MMNFVQALNVALRNYPPRRSADHEQTKIRDSSSSQISSLADHSLATMIEICSRPSWDEYALPPPTAARHAGKLRGIINYAFLRNDMNSKLTEEEMRRALFGEPELAAPTVAAPCTTAFQRLWR
jgi:hypothetical protein